MYIDIYIGNMHLTAAQHATELDLIVDHNFYMYMCQCFDNGGTVGGDQPL